MLSVLVDNIPLIWGDDFNMIFDTYLDAIGCTPNLMINVYEINYKGNDLCDIYRTRNSYSRCLTSRGVGSYIVNWQRCSLYLLDFEIPILEILVSLWGRLFASSLIHMVVSFRVSNFICLSRRAPHHLHIGRTPQYEGEERHRQATTQFYIFLAVSKE